MDFVHHSRHVKVCVITTSYETMGNCYMQIHKGKYLRLSIPYTFISSASRNTEANIRPIEIKQLNKILTQIFAELRAFAGKLRYLQEVD